MRRIKTPANREPDELGREARRLLAELEGGSAIRRDGEGRFHLADGRSVSPGAAQGKGLPKRLVAGCLAADWLERRGDTLVLSEAGRSWLRRSSEEGDAFRGQHQLRTMGDREVDGASRR